MTHARTMPALACGGLALALLGGCSPRPSATPQPTAHATPETPRVDAPEPTPPSPTVDPAPPRDEGPRSVLVTDASVLAALEADGLSLGPLVFGGGDGHPTSFADDPGWASIRARIERDLQARQAADPKSGVGMKFAHRLFDSSWLRDPKLRFELVAVVNRLDRRAFDHVEPAERCGEVRLVYRLAYATTLEGKPVDSRLPMTINVVFWQPGACPDVARRWPTDTERDPKAWVAALRDGPLSRERLTAKWLDAVEVNLQMLRWPAVVHPSLGGHAEYAMRVFKRSGTSGPFAPSPLENTPDVARIAADPKLRDALRTWIAENVAGIDAGTAVMPDALAADLAVSVTPRGLARLGNRPFSQLVAPADLAGIALGDATRTTTPAALLRRLDELSCQGCHETRSVAGFHVLGEPRDPDAVVDTLAIAISPHLRADLDRRQRYVANVLAGATVDEARELASFEASRGYGSPCGLGDPAFASWTCPAEMTCQKLDDPLHGICVPERPSAGDPCQLGTLRSRAKPDADRVRDVVARACSGDAVCNVDRVGFPTGMCTATCDRLASGEGCGPIVDLTTFNNCVGRRRPFPACIELAARPVGLRACDETSACRDDYVCARGERGGVCLPPYFLFQLRVDGHVL